jgi:excisionase family DNA binding protein
MSRPNGQRYQKGAKAMADTNKITIEPGAIYSRQEAAAALGVSLSTLKRLIKKGYLQASKPGGMRRVFITGESILMMLEDTSIERNAS